MDASLYEPTFLAFTTICCIWIGGKFLFSPNYALQEKQNSFVWPLLISIVLVLWIGFRPVSYLFGDTVNYALEYRLLKLSIVSIDWSKDWIWQWLMMSCKGAGLSINSFFAIVEAGYIFSILWAVKILMPSNPMLGMLFVMSSFSFFSYGVNGLRNGLACHIIILAMTYILEGKYAKFIILSLLAFGIHRSTLLPIASILAGVFFIKNLKYAIYFWITSIFISLVAGGTITNLFASLGFDDRMSNYATNTTNMHQFSQTGFRWDFLLYSSMPILLGWYISVKHKIEDNWFHVICSTYCLCNAFWVIVIRAAFSNRFAYLSWFLYPIVIAYPLINMPVWEDQDRKTGLILLAYCGFTFFMSVFYW